MQDDVPFELAGLFLGSIFIFDGVSIQFETPPKYPTKRHASPPLVLVDRFQDRGRYEEAIAIFEGKHKEDAALELGQFIATEMPDWKIG